MMALALSLAMILGLTWQPAFAVGDARPVNLAYHYFYKQLGPQAQKIYDALETAYTSGNLESGTKGISLDGVIGSSAATDYLKGNRSLFNDFSAAKDAFDLEHPEAWYFDSAQLSLNVTGNTTSATASMGTGKSDRYYVMGVKNAEDAASKTTELEKRVKTIADAAKNKSGTYEKIKYVHDQVINSISYKYEFECKTGNEGFIRTAYALITGEGVCEGYVRSFQMILNELDIPCVPIHGMQTTGTPEQHMWCAVYISDDKGTGWYVVDPTWDDPLPDGHERDDYFMVGNDVIAANWIPSGHVSTGTMEFTYPSIAPRSYGAGQIESNDLVVTYDESVMESLKSMVYHISYKGKGVYQSAKDGYHLLTRMYKTNADGSVNAFDDWYYSYHMLYSLSGTPGPFDPNNNLQNTGNMYYHDTDEYLVQNVVNCDYVEFAVTKVAPVWSDNEELADKGGYLKDHGGTEADIIAQTGPIYNPNGNYEPPPYVRNMTPSQQATSYVGATHTIHMEFTDQLFHPDQASIDKSAALGKVNEAETARAESIGLDYTGINYSWGMNSGLPHQFAVRPVPKNVRWYCATCEEVHYANGAGKFPDITSECRLTTLEFEFTPSVMWADDSVFYQFYLTGLVGVKSNKKPSQTGMALAFENASCSTCYRCPSRGGIDWNLWGQPQLLDDPNNLEFSKMVVEGIDSSDRQSIEDLYKNMNLDDYDMNGRLLLVVEDAGADKAKANTMSDLLESKMSVDLQNAVASALYEIDFARICGRTIVETGQSLRMQVGFPAGFDASNLSTTVFKVYHFIKNPAGDITGVEEIPVTVTPYGLVFQVKSFSPFAIVAEEVEEGEAVDSRSVVLVSDGNGTIEAVGYTPNKNEKGESTEVEGTLTLLPGKSCIIKIKPNTGYAVESFTATGFTGKYGEADSDGTYTFTLSYSDIGASNAMIGVTFVKVENKPASVEVLSLCSHEKVTSTGGRAATCTVNGVAPTVTCDNCGQVLSGGEVIQATGHVYEKPEVYNGPTCTQPGTELECTVCHAKSQAPALGHEYDKGVCVRDGAVESYTVTFNPNGGRIKAGQSAEVTVAVNSTLDKESWPEVERSGYVFSGWYLVPSPGEGDKAVSSLTVTRNITLYAAWNGDGPGEANSCVISVTASPSDGGTVSGGGSYKTGDTVTLTASPKSGYSFSHWSEGGSVVSILSTYSFTAAFDRTLVAVFTQNSSSEAPGESGGAPGAGVGGSGTTVTTVTAEDGTVTTTVTDNKTGASTVTVTRPDGSVSVTETDAAGNISRQESFADGVRISTKIPVSGSVIASVSLPAGMKSASVMIHAPVTAGTVAVNSATGKVVMRSVPVGDDGLKVVLDGSANLILVDLSMDFIDMPSGHWAADSVDFVTAHGLFNGTGDDKFSPDAHMTRAMLMTVLARFDGVDTTSSSPWYKAGMEWAVANEISDGSNPDADITREQLAVMLYRYAGSPELNGADGLLSGYPDVGEIDDWASLAMRWAVQNGIIQGTDGRLNPLSKAIRTEVSTMIERFCRNIATG